MQKQEIWKFYIILGFILLPFIALYNLVKKGAEDLSDGGAFVYYFFILIILMQIIQIINLYF